MVYDSMEVIIANHFSTIEILEQKRLLLPDLRYNIASLRNKNESLKSDFNSHILRYATHDPYMQLERILIDLEDVGLEVVTFFPEEMKKKDFYDREIIDFKVSGEFEKIVSFLRLFNSHNMLAKFKRSVVSHEDGGLILNATMALYSVREE